MNYILFDGNFRNNLLPFTYTRPVSEIRVGILKIKEKWNLSLNSDLSFLTEDYLSVKYPLTITDENTFINASLVPNTILLNEIRSLKGGDVLVQGDEVLAYSNSQAINSFEEFNKIETESNPIIIKNTWDIFSKNGECIQLDFDLLTTGKESQPIPSSVNVISPENIFIEEGAQLEFVTINASKGPVYIGRNSEVMEGSVIRGPFALCDSATVKLGAKIYGPTTIGPHSKVGGEVNNSVIFGYSNKGHDGFLGNSVLGEWCNLGADSNNSNLKNNYAEVRLWDYNTEGFARTGLQFCGLMMGDHSKCGINTMFNTGTVVGVCSNIFGSGFPRNFVPSFSWGGSSGFTTYLTRKAFEVSKIVMNRRSIEFTQEDEKILLNIFEQTKKYRKS